MSTRRSPPRGWKVVLEAPPAQISAQFATELYTVVVHAARDESLHIRVDCAATRSHWEGIVDANGLCPSRGCIRNGDAVLGILKGSLMSNDVPDDVLVSTQVLHRGLADLDLIVHKSIDNLTATLTIPLRRTSDCSVGHVHDGCGDSDGLDTHLPKRPLWLDLYTSQAIPPGNFAAWCGYAEGFDLVDNLAGVLVHRPGRYCVRVQGVFGKTHGHNAVTILVNTSVVANSKQLVSSEKHIDLAVVVTLSEGNVVRVQAHGPKTVLEPGAVLNMYELSVR